MSCGARLRDLKRGCEVRVRDDVEHLDAGAKDGHEDAGDVTYAHTVTEAQTQAYTSPAVAILLVQHVLHALHVHEQYHARYYAHDSHLDSNSDSDKNATAQS